MEIGKFYPTDEMLKDVIKLDVKPGGGLSVFADLQWGMSMLNTIPTYVQQVSETQQMEKKYKQTKSTRIYDETEKGSR